MLQRKKQQSWQHQNSDSHRDNSIRTCKELAKASGSGSQRRRHNKSCGWTRPHTKHPSTCYPFFFSFWIYTTKCDKIQTQCSRLAILPNKVLSFHRQHVECSIDGPSLIKHNLQLFLRFPRIGCHPLCRPCWPRRREDKSSQQSPQTWTRIECSTES